MIVASAEGVLGEVALRRRHDGVLQLWCAGVLVMESDDDASERALADQALARAGSRDAEGAPLLGGRVLVGGLGLGRTCAHLLAGGAGHVVVVEVEPALVAWVRRGLVPGAEGLLEDPRTEVVVGDVRAELAARARTSPASLDAVLLDVDNGPDHLVHPGNARLYGTAALADTARCVRPGGVVVVWSSTRSRPLLDALTSAVGRTEVVAVPLVRAGVPVEYLLHAARRPTRHDEAMSEQTDQTTPAAEGADGGDFRVEHDTMGEVRVPRTALYRAQTQRAVENFPISGTPLSRAHIEAIARVKKAAAQANAELGILPQDVADAIVAAAEEVASGAHDAHFPVDVFQTGSGTSSNMNANEVIATLATRRLGRDVHPNDHVNASQSSNDTFPTSVHVAATAGVVQDLVPALEHLEESLARKAEELAEVVKSGRTHLMDATPVTLGQEFSGYAQQVRYGVARVQNALPRTAEVPLGGTATGTGINTPAGFPQRVIELLAADTGLPLTEAPDHFEAQGARDGLVELSGALRTVAVSLTKICNDLRWMGSGPNTGLGELRIPDLQPGSSIMPGKVNPVVPEAVLMVCAQVVGNDATIAWAGASGAFELNVAIPVMARNVLESIRLLANASRLLADRTVDGLEADVEKARAYAESSPSIVTPLNRVIGYEAAAKVAKHAVAQQVTVREAVVALGFVERGEITEEQLDSALDVLAMTRPPQPR